jgi:hypothetical protein
MALGSCNSIQKGLTKTVNKKSKMKITAQRTSELWTYGKKCRRTSRKVKSMNPIQEFGFAWLALAAALALHVTDEAMTDFLGSYNPAVRAIRKRIPFLPIPTFTFGWWLAGLCAGIFLLFALSPYAFQGSRWLLRASYPLAVLMFANGLGHVVGSLYFRRLLPGVYSSPILIAASVFLFLSALSQQ